MLFLYFNFSFHYFIRHFNTNLYIGDSTKSNPGRYILPVNKSKRINFKFKNDRDGSIYITQDNKSHIFTSKNNWTLSYDAISYTSNQKFNLFLVRPGIYKIKHFNKCVEYSPEDQKYITKDCTDSIYQLFNIFKYDEEKKIFRLKISDKSYVDSLGLGYYKNKLPVIYSNSDRLNKLQSHFNKIYKIKKIVKNNTMKEDIKNNNFDDRNYNLKFKNDKIKIGNFNFDKRFIDNNIYYYNFIYDNSHTPTITTHWKSNHLHHHHENDHHFGISVKYSDTSLASKTSASSYSKAMKLIKNDRLIKPRRSSHNYKNDISTYNELRNHFNLHN